MAGKGNFNMKNTFWFWFWLLTGLLLGGLIAGVCAGVPGLSWLAYSQSLSLSPAADLVVFQFSLVASFTLNIAQVICVIIAMICHRYFH